MKKLFLAILMLALALLPVLAMGESADELTLSVELDKTTLAVGESILGTWETTGGTAPYSYNFYWILKENGQESWVASGYYTESVQSTLTPLFGSSGYLRVEVRDAQGGWSLEFAEFTITGSPPVEALGLSLSLDKTTVAVDKGESVTLNCIPQGGTPPYTFSYDWEVSENEGEWTRVQDSWGSTDTSDVFMPRYGASGRVRVHLRDSLGRQLEPAEAAFSITGAVTAEPLELALTFEETTVDIAKGEAAAPSWAASGGTEPYQYNFYWIIDGEWVQGKSESTLTSDTFKPLYGTSGEFHIHVTDSLGRSSYQSRQFTITGDTAQPLSLAILLDKTSVAAGTPIRGTWEATGGTPPYSYDFDWNITENGNVSWVGGGWESISTEAAFTPKFGSSGKLLVAVSDALGRKTSESVDFVITGSPQTQPLLMTVTLNKYTVDAGKGESVTASWTVEGGQPPYQTSYYWTVQEGAGRETYIEGNEGDGPGEDAFAPKFGSAGRFFASVRDNVGREYSTEKTFSITGSPQAQPLLVSVVVDKTSLAVDKGESVTGTWSASGGEAPYTYGYTWYLQALGKDFVEGVESQYKTDKLTDSFRPFHGQTLYLEVTVTDRLGRTKYKESERIAITGNEAAQPLTISAQLDKTSVAVGDAIKGSWSAQGGKGPYVFEYSWQVREEWESDYNWVKSAYNIPDLFDSFSPKYGTAGILRVGVTDSLGRTSEITKTFTITGAVKADPLVLNLSLNKSAAAVSEEITGSWTAGGGTGPYLYEATWSVEEESGDYVYGVKNMPLSDSLSDSFSPAYGVKGWLNVTVTDSTGRRMSETKRFSITGAAAVSPLTFTLGLNKADAAKGDTVIASWNTTGGTGGYTYDVTWLISENASGIGANTVRTLQGTAGADDSLLLSYGSYGSVYVRVQDKDGRYAWAEENFSITGSQAAQTPLQAIITLNPPENAKGGETMSASLVAAGGTSPYTYAFDWYLRPLSAAGQTKKFASSPQGETTSHSAVLPSSGGEGYVAVTLSDKDGRIAVFEKYFLIQKGLVRRGDANADGGVSILDLVSIIDYIVSGTPCKSMENADANASPDGVVDILDLVWVIDAIVGG